MTSATDTGYGLLDVSLVRVLVVVDLLLKWNMRVCDETTQEIANALTAYGRGKPVPPGVHNDPGEAAR